MGKVLGGRGEGRRFVRLSLRVERVRRYGEAVRRVYGASGFVSAISVYQRKEREGGDRPCGGGCFCAGAMADPERDYFGLCGISLRRNRPVPSGLEDGCGGAL